MDEMSYEEVLQQVGCLLTRNIGYSMLPLLRQNQVLPDRHFLHHVFLDRYSRFLRSSSASSEDELCTPPKYSK